MNYSSKNKICINNKIIGHDEPCFIIAEIGINHNGSIDIAKQLIDEAVLSGADAVKFQKRHLDQIYKNDFLLNPNLESQGFEILLDVLKNVEFDHLQYQEIIDYCKSKNILFLCTAWDKKSVDFLENFDIPAYKIASADLTNLPLIKYICETKKPILISTGMSSLDEIKKSVDFLKSLDANFILLHSNSTYPAPIENLNLSLIKFYEETFEIPIGYSGHEYSIIPSIMAYNLGAVVIERHITLDKNMEGLDHSASLNPADFNFLVKSIRECEKSFGKPIKKISRGETLQREILGKSILVSENIENGEIFSEKNLEIKGPAKGISPQFYYDLLGKQAKRKINQGEFLLDDDL